VSKRLQHDRLDRAIRAVVDEVLDGPSSRSTTVTLMRRAVDRSGLPEGLYFRSTPETGDLYNSVLHKMLPERQRAARLSIELPPSERHPDGGVVNISAVEFVPSILPPDQQRRRPGRLCQARFGLRTLDLRPEEISRVVAMHRHWDREPDNWPSTE
jgi:hypothetical protein